jgi:parallel beta-helix repeat protein
MGRTVTAQLAWPDLGALLKEPVEPAASLMSLITYQAPLSLVPLPEPLMVTEEELALVGTSGTAIALSGGSPDFIVDDDLVECPDATFTTAAGIQLAVASPLVPPGSRIRVCPGLYTPVNIPAGKDFLTLEAPRQHGQATQCQAALVPDPTKDAIVDAMGSPAIGFNILANGTTIFGFTVQNTANNPGIFTSSLASGHRLLSNVVQQNTIGLYLNSSGVFDTLVSHNCFRLNIRPGAAGGNGIYSDQGLRNARVNENYFTGNPSASMVFALNQQDIVIDHNDIVDDAGTIVLVSTQNALVEFNHLIRHGGSGVFLGGAVSDTVIRFNRMDDGSTGINSNVQFAATPNEVRIEKNHIRGGTNDGIRLNNTDNSTVSGNKVEGKARDGIRLQNDSNMNAVNNNLSRDNGRDGIRVESPTSTPTPSAQSSANTIEMNKMLGNVEHDCHDDTTGAGTAGTANFWIKNNGKTQNRPGLCRQ